ncbi:MAG: PTS sugar transporter subunit IIA [Candidatus Hydrogenedentota bacterium]|nr:MAG: PTS sugar transporter subunit IIA [Candidatus Hydrogenedentota bacterium]
MLKSALVSKAHLLELPEGREEALRAAVGSLAAEVGLDEEEVFAAVMEREKVMATGMGHGVAIPHAKIKGIDDFKIAICKSSHPIEYESMDSVPVRILVLLLSPEERVRDHVKIIAEISKKLKFSVVRQGILDAKTPQEMEKAFLN